MACLLINLFQPIADRSRRRHNSETLADDYAARPKPLDTVPPTPPSIEKLREFAEDAHDGHLVSIQSIMFRLRGLCLDLEPTEASLRLAGRRRNPPHRRRMRATADVPAIRGGSRSGALADARRRSDGDGGAPTCKGRRSERVRRC